MFAAEIHCCDDVCHIHASRDHTRSSVNHFIIDFASFAITRVTWLNQLATHVASQGSSSIFGEHHVLPRSKRSLRNERHWLANLTETKKWLFSPPSPVSQTSSGSTRE